MALLVVHILQQSSRRCFKLRLFLILECFKGLFLANEGWLLFFNQSGKQGKTIFGRLVKI